ncbi:MAG TPA: hypothetical protein VIL86_07525 [Tepidisphaeraceae bacterium]
MPVAILPPVFVPKIWGSTQLEPWYRDAPERIGEVWYPLGALLIKFLFTTENLSVQVHPGDEYAAQHHASRGKTEMWHILRAAPDAAVAVGFRGELGSPQQLLEASESGRIMDLMQWSPARPGDTFFIPAGTVHAIGAGLALCEIQQNSDVTYRLYDYGRDRELHLAHGVNVAHLGRHSGAARPVKLADGRVRLVECQYFHTDALEVHGAARIADRVDAVVVIEGQVDIAGTPAQAGAVAKVSGETELRLRSERGARLLLAST